MSAVAAELLMIARAPRTDVPLLLVASSATAIDSAMIAMQATVSSDRTCTYWERGTTAGSLVTLIWLMDVPPA